MQDRTHAIIAIKYLLNLQTFSTVKKFDVLGAFYDKTEEEIKNFSTGCSLALEASKDRVDKDFCMLTAFEIQQMAFNGQIPLEAVKKWVDDNCCYEWGRNWKSEEPKQKTP